MLSPLSAVTASRVAEAQVTELRELFACFDADRDGKLTTLELCSVIRALGHAPTSAELTALQMTVENVYGGRTFGALRTSLPTAVRAALALSTSPCRRAPGRALTAWAVCVRGVRPYVCSAQFRHVRARTDNDCGAQDEDHNAGHVCISRQLEML